MDKYEKEAFYKEESDFETKQETGDVVFTIKDLTPLESAQYVSKIFEALKQIDGCKHKNITYDYNSTKKKPAYRGPG